jgi:hypothetical protein
LPWNQQGGASIGNIDNLTPAIHPDAIQSRKRSTSESFDGSGSGRLIIRWKEAKKKKTCNYRKPDPPPTHRRPPWPPAAARESEAGAGIWKREAQTEQTPQGHSREIQIGTKFLDALVSASGYCRWGKEESEAGPPIERARRPVIECVQIPSTSEQSN